MANFNAALVVVSIFGIWLSGNVEAKHIPDFVPLCKEHSANISECWMNTFNMIMPHLADGLPAMKLRKIEPLLVERIDLKFGDKALTVDAQVQDMKIYGLKNLRATHVDLNTDIVVIKIDVSLPFVNLEGNFKAVGNVLQNEINGKGSFIGNCTNLSAKTTWAGKKILKKDVVYVTMETGDVDLDIGDIKMKFEGLTPSASVNEHLNNIINDNIDILYEVAKPAVIETTKSILFDSMNNVFHSFPFNVLYPKED